MSQYIKYYLIRSKPEVLSIEASAGTGKTHSLSLRYLSILKEEKEPSKILAVTFTNKAANEMKERLIGTLKKIALQEKDIEEDLKDLRSAEAEELLNKILYNFHQFNVKTIDSFVTSLGKSYSLALSLLPEMEISFNDSLYLKKALKNLIEEYDPSLEKGKFFLDFFKNIHNFKKDMAWDVFGIFFDELNGLIKLENKTGKNLKIIEDLENLKLLKEKIISLINDIGLENFKNPDKIEKIAKGEKNIEDYQIDFKKDYKNIRKKEEFSKFYNEYLKNYPFSLNLPGMLLFSLFKKSFLKILDEEKVNTLNNLYRILIENLNGKNLYTEKLIYLGEELKHYLIDEFQDTSWVQWNIFYPILENSFAEGGTLFYVGDKKQAIYGWRGGDYELFDKIQVPPSVHNIRKESLNKNFRCKKKILDFIKNIFGEENLSKIGDGKKPLILEKVKKHFKVVEESIPAKDGGYLYYEFIPKKEEELKEVALNKLKEFLEEKLLKKYKLEEITILVRSNAEAMEILNFLLENNIPAISPTALWLFSCGRVREIYSLLKLLENPEDNLSFSHFLLSEIFLKKSKTKEEDWLKFLFENKENKIFFYSFKSKYEEIYKELLKDLFYSLDYISAYELINKIINKFELLKNFEEDEGFFYGFLEWVLNLQKEGFYSTKEILKKIDELGDEDGAKITMDPNLPQIKVMTIHKAKGLGFPVVILPFLKMPQYKGSTLYKIEGDDVIPFGVRDLDILKKIEENFNIYKEFYTKEIIEELNNIYVAMTRAIEALIIFELEPHNASINSLFEAFKDKPYEVGNLREEIEEKKGEEKKYYDYHSWKDRLIREKIDINLYYDFERLKKIQEGIKKHKELQMGKFEGIPVEFIDLIEPKDYISKEWEVEMVNEKGEVFRSDLLIEFKDRVSVLDFKFGEEKKEDIKQVKNYKEILEKIYKKPIFGYILYFQGKKVVKI